MKEINLSQGKVAIVDDDDFEWLSQWKWHYGITGKCACRNTQLTEGYEKRGLIYMHREIMHTPKGMDTDHINGNALDNRKSNLRICTHSDNIKNTGPRGNNTSGFKGVSFYKPSGKWRARIAVNDTTIYLGYYGNPEDAAQAYDEAAKKYHGEFAKTNFLQQSAG